MDSVTKAYLAYVACANSRTNGAKAFTLHWWTIYQEAVAVPVNE